MSSVAPEVLSPEEQALRAEGVTSLAVERGAFYGSRKTPAPAAPPSAAAAPDAPSGITALPSTSRRGVDVRPLVDVWDERATERPAIASEGPVSFVCESGQARKVVAYDFAAVLFHGAPSLLKCATR